MRKQELVDALAQRAELKKTDAKKAVNALTEILSEELAKGETVNWPGLGTFETVYYPPRASRNPAKGETIETEGGYCPKFRPGKKLRDAVKKNGKEK